MQIPYDMILKITTILRGKKDGAVQISIGIIAWRPTLRSHNANMKKNPTEMKSRIISYCVPHPTAGAWLCNVTSVSGTRTLKGKLNVLRTGVDNTYFHTKLKRTRALIPRKAPIQSTVPFLSTEDSAGRTSHNVPKNMAPVIALDVDNQQNPSGFVPPENSHRKEEPSPLSPFDEYADEESTEIPSDRSCTTQASEAKVPRFPRRKSGSNDSYDVRHHERSTNTSQGSRDGEGDETACAEAIYHRPEDPPGSTDEDDVLVSIYCTDATADKDECAVGESG